MLIAFSLLFTSEVELLLKAHGQQNCVSYSSQGNFIRIICDTKFHHIAKQLDPSVMEDKGDGQYISRATIRVNAEATLIIAWPEVSWVKITGDNGILNKGVLEVDGVRITSWDEEANDVIRQEYDGSVRRAWGISVINSSSSSIKNSEISHLGYNESRKQGITAYDSSNFTMIGNTVHNMWMGFYSANASNIVIFNNTFNENIKYAIDPHTGTHDMLITNNHVYNNSGIAVICSLDCYNIMFEHNEVHDNGYAGLFFSRNTSDSIMRFNNVYNHDTTCIAVHSSPDNLIHDNTLSDCYNGIYVQHSDGNVLANNTISGTQHSVRLVDSQVSSDSDYIRNSLASHEYLLSADSQLNISNHSFKDKSIRAMSETNKVIISDSGMAEVTLKTVEDVINSQGYEISVTSEYQTYYDTDATPYSATLSYQTLVVNNIFPPNYFIR